MSTSEHPETGALVHFEAGKVVLEGNLIIPSGAGALILFAHGSGSSRHSPRNRYVAGALHQAGFGTLLFDLLIPREEAIDAGTAEFRFNIDLLAERLIAATDWAIQQPEFDLPIGYFGASTGAAAALVAAAERSDGVGAVVSRGGRPDLASDSLQRVLAPALLIVGGNDPSVIRLNRDALGKLASPDKRLVIVPAAGHLFEEPGALDEVARQASDWFASHLRRPASARAV